MPADPKSEIRKLGTGEPVDHDLLWEQMSDDGLVQDARNLSPVNGPPTSLRRPRRQRPSSRMPSS
jgi:hypothetical protein